MDLAIVPSDHVPGRFIKRLHYQEDFVLAMRRGHRFARDPSLSRYCSASHLVVSLEGDPRGFVDEIIQPRQTRAKLISALAACENKRDRNLAKKHGNIPL